MARVHLLNRVQSRELVKWVATARLENAPLQRKLYLATAPEKDGLNPTFTATRYSIFITSTHSTYSILNILYIVKYLATLGRNCQKNRSRCLRSKFWQKSYEYKGPHDWNPATISFELQFCLKLKECRYRNFLSTTLTRQPFRCPKWRGKGRGAFFPLKVSYVTFFLMTRTDPWLEPSEEERDKQDQRTHVTSCHSNVNLARKVDKEENLRLQPKVNLEILAEWLEKTTKIDVLCFSTQRWKR